MARGGEKFEGSDRWEPTAADRVVVLEDDPMLRDLLTEALAMKFQPAVVESFGVGVEAMQHIREHGASVLICDLGLPDLDGRDVMRKLRAELPDLKLIVLTGRIQSTLPAELVALGVGGFVDKRAALEHTVRAVERVMAGGMYFYAGVSPQGTPRRATAGESTSPTVLTEREREVVRLVASGLSSKEVATELDISVRTVENYRASSMRKLGVRDTVALVRWSIANGLA